MRLETGATTVAHTGVSVDTNVHTVEITGNDAAASFQVTLDGTAFNTTYTTIIPASTTNIPPLWMIETNESGVLKSFDYFHIEVEIDD